MYRVLSRPELVKVFCFHFLSDLLSEYIRILLCGLQIADEGNQDSDSKFRALVVIGSLVSFEKEVIFAVAILLMLQGYECID